MPGPLTSVGRVRDLGGLTDDAVTNFKAHFLFGYADDAALIARITTEIAVASAWLQSRGGSDYASGDTVKDTLFAEAEAYLALQPLYETLKMRKVTGIHHPLQSEGSERFQELIDVEMPAHIAKFIDAYIAPPEDPGRPWAAPAMALSRPIDRRQPTYVSQREQLDDTIDEATGLPVVTFPLTTDGQGNSR